MAGKPYLARLTGFLRGHDRLDRAALREDPVRVVLVTDFVKLQQIQALAKRDRPGNQSSLRCGGVL
jgi:hypothetical protein